jgi:hypothetical protein
MRFTVTLLLFCTVASSARPQTLTHVSPDVIAAGPGDVVVTLRGRGLATGSQVRFQNCSGDTARAVITRGVALTVQVPAAMLRRPCVLRVRLSNSMQEVPLAVADPTLAGLAAPPPADPNDVPPWAGQFNMLCEEDTTTAPLFQSTVAVTPDTVARRQFVLGKGRRVVMRLGTAQPKQRPATPSGGGCFYVVLPGVTPDDVQWGPHDVEGFWIGVLEADGRTIRDRQPLSGMVQESAGPTDRN